MRTRFTVLAALVCGLAAIAMPAGASAAPRHDHELTINATPNPDISGAGVLIYGQLNGAGNGDQKITLYHRVAPASHFSVVSTTMTESNGFFEFTRADGVVTTNRYWFVRGPDQSHSRTMEERVSALVTLADSPSTGTTGEPIVLSGTVSPTHDYQRVEIQQQDSASGNAWHEIASTYTNGSSAFSVPHRFGTPGDHVLRALFPGDRRNTAGFSDQLVVQIQQKQNDSFTINSSSPLIPDGSPVKISGMLYEPGSSSTVVSNPTEVTLYGQQYGHSFRAIATTSTSDGAYTFTQTPDSNTVYKVETTLAPRRVTSDLYEGVQDVVTIGTGSLTATDGETISVAGGVTPDHAGHVIYLQRLDSSGHWQNVKAGVLTTGSRYAFTYTFGQTGTVELRARIYGGPENVGGASAALTFTVAGLALPTTLPPAS